jgi:hypothetical protein
MTMLSTLEPTTNLGGKQERDDFDDVMHNPSRSFDLSGSPDVRAGAGV